MVRFTENHTTSINKPSIINKINLIPDIPAPAVRFQKKQDGKDLAIMNGYTFYNHQTYTKTKLWSCTSRGCNARLIITNEETTTRRDLVAAKGKHKHAKPKFIIIDGYLIRL